MIPHDFEDSSDVCSYMDDGLARRMVGMHDQYRRNEKLTTILCCL
jgi:hypothetical protein